MIEPRDLESDRRGLPGEMAQQSLMLVGLAEDQNFSSQTLVT